MPASIPASSSKSTRILCLNAGSGMLPSFSNASSNMCVRRMVTRVPLCQPSSIDRASFRRSCRMATLSFRGMKKGTVWATSRVSSGFVFTALHTMSECHSSRNGRRPSRSLSMPSRRTASSFVGPGTYSTVRWRKPYSCSRLTSTTSFVNLVSSVHCSRVRKMPEVKNSSSSSASKSVQAALTSSPRQLSRSISTAADSSSPETASRFPATTFQTSGTRVVEKANSCRRNTCLFDAPV
mmetsp:Transcript_15638/g.61098  ORF Transcript_15638/g.61098 Transcript_15638/m.61098 type:complete len:238 (+) Transcript_15638:1068-1781(+)